MRSAVRVLQQIRARGAGETVRHAPHLSSPVPVRTNAENRPRTGFASIRRDAEVAVTDEPWLFPGEDGVPPTGEQFTDP
jgi:hypothetical protein